MRLNRYPQMQDIASLFGIDLSKRIVTEMTITVKANDFVILQVTELAPELTEAAKSTRFALMEISPEIDPNVQQPLSLHKQEGDPQ